MADLKVLVVDDSAFNRRTIAELLSGIAGVHVIGKAADGDEAVRLTMALQPDLITLDLEMPRMDGFKFLRLLMASRPTPVIVISGQSAKPNVFRALELGAIDFIAKPATGTPSDLAAIREELASKVEMVRQLSPALVDPRKRITALVGHTVTDSHLAVSAPEKRISPRAIPPRKVVVIGASTGGPTAILEIFSRLPPQAPATIVVAQHMPSRFTRTFAERLDKLGSFHVAEGSDLDTLLVGRALICPGGQCAEIIQRGELALQVTSARPTDRYVPSVDRLFESAAEVCGDKVIGVVLTGMGDDGARGTAAIKAAGGTVLVESAATAVVYGMPGAAMRMGSVDQCLPLRSLADHLTNLLTSGVS